MVWPEIEPSREDPEIVEARKKNKALQGQLIAIYADEVKERIESMQREGIPILPPNMMPNQSTDPTLSSGTPAAGQPARHP
jgi:hypothetical protein